MTSYFVGVTHNIFFRSQSQLLLSSCKDKNQLCYCLYYQDHVLLDSCRLWRLSYFIESWRVRSSCLFAIWFVVGEAISKSILKIHTFQNYKWLQRIICFVQTLMKLNKSPKPKKKLKMNNWFQISIRVINDGTTTKIIHVMPDLQKMVHKLDYRPSMWAIGQFWRDSWKSSN